MLHREVIALIAAIYSRKSKFTEKGESIENQIQMCKNYGVNLGVKDFIIYEDEGFSGGNTDRPNFQRLLKDAAGGAFNVLICYRLDRISRNVNDFSNTISILDKYNIKFVSITEQFDTTKPLGRAMMNISATFAQLERETIAERIRDNKMELAKTGRWLGGTTPLGYKSEPYVYTDENGKTKKLFHLVHIHDQVELVKLIFNLYIEKESYNSVANYLCRYGFKGRNGGEFTRDAVKKIVTNPVYCIADKHILKYFNQNGSNVNGTPSSCNGLMVYNKTDKKNKDNPISQWIISVGKHQGIIDSKFFLKCKEISTRNSLTPPRSGTGDKFLLSGLLICGYCYSSMHSWSHKNKYGYIERHYRCSLKTKASNRCCNTMLNSYKAQDILLSKIKTLSKDDIIKNFNSTYEKTLNENIIIKEKNRLISKTEKNKKIISSLIKKLAFINDNNIVEMIKSELNSIKDENKDLENQLISLENQISPTSEIKYDVDTVWSAIEDFSKSSEILNTKQLRFLIKSFIENILWYGNDHHLEVNFIMSGKIIPPGKIKRRKLCISPDSR